MAKLSKKELAVKECEKFQGELNKIIELINVGKATRIELDHAIKEDSLFKAFLDDNKEVLDNDYEIINNARLDTMTEVHTEYRNLNEFERNEKLFKFDGGKLYLVSGFRFKGGRLESIPAILDTNIKVLDETMLPLTVKIIALLGYTALYENALSERKTQEDYKANDDERFNNDKLYIANYVISLIEGHFCNTNYLELLNNDIIDMVTRTLGKDATSEKIEEYIASCKSNLLKGFVASIGYKISYEVFEGTYTLVANLKDYMLGGKDNYKDKFHQTLQQEIFFNLRDELRANPLFFDTWLRDKASDMTNKQRFSRYLLASSVSNALQTDKKTGKEKYGEVKKEEYFCNQIVLYIRYYSR